jgi:hypothetical protein
MIIRFARWALAAMLPCCAGAASAQAQSDWEIAKTDDQCLLSRTFAAPDPAVLVFSSSPGSDAFALVVAVRKIEKHPKIVVEVQIGLDGTGRTIKGWADPGRIGGATPDAFKVKFISPEDLATIGRASALRLTYPAGTLGPFTLPDAAEAVAALQDCLAEHLVAKGADPAQFRPGGSPPVPLKSRDDFLSVDQLRKVLAAGVNTGAPLGFRLVVDAQGRVAGCARSGPGQTEKVEQAACGMLTGQTLFKPAHDPAGTAVKGVATFDVPLIVRRDYVSTTPLN